jgi:hypothetical protein
MSFLSDQLDKSGGSFFDPANIFGTPEIKKKTFSTMTEQQLGQLNAFIKSLTNRGQRSFGGDVSVGQSDLQGLSLEALENRVRELSDPNFQSSLDQREQDLLLKMMDFEGQNLGIDEFFQTNVQDPLVEQFTEDILPQIGRNFGGANFFSGERARADDQARDDLLTSLTRSRSQLAFDADTRNRNLALQALGLSQDRDALIAQELATAFGAGSEATALEERNVSREFEQFLAESNLDDESMKLLLSAIGLPRIENVVSGGGGGSGAAGLASIFASIFSSSSDRRLKSNIRKVGKVNGYNIYTWTWNYLAKALGIGGPTIGVMAQEVLYTGRVFLDKNGFFKVNYFGLFGGK